MGARTNYGVAASRILRLGVGAASTIRRVGSDGGFVACDCCECSHGYLWSTLGPFYPAPLGMVLLLQLVLSLRESASWRMLAAAALAIGGICWTMHTAPWVRNGFAPLHLCVLAMFTVALFFDDAPARVIRRAAPIVLPMFGLLTAIIWSSIFPHIPLIVHMGIAMVLAGMAFLVWRRERQTAHLAAVLASLQFVFLAGFRAGLAELEGTLFAAGRDWLLGGLICLVIGVLISLAKGGVLRTIWPSLAEWNRRLQSAA